MKFIITRDLIANDFLPPTLLLTDDYNPKEYPVKFSLFDDDGIKYFEGRAKDDDLSVLAAVEWGMYYAGVTHAKINGEVFP